MGEPIINKFPVVSDQGRELIDHVVAITGLEESTAMDLFRKGWEFSEALGNPHRWTSINPYREIEREDYAYKQEAPQEDEPQEDPEQGADRLPRTYAGQCIASFWEARERRG